MISYGLAKARAMAGRDDWNEREAIKSATILWYDTEEEGYELEVENEDDLDAEDFRAWVEENADSLAHEDAAANGTTFEGIEDIDYMRSMGADVKPGDFAENITTEGVELSTYPIGTHFRIGEDILLELTQIGKECHSGCEIRRLVGTCIMPKKGVFCRILKGGTVKPGDPFFVVNEKAGQ